MNALFEEYVGRICRQVLRPIGFEVDLHKSDAYLARDVERGRYAFLLRPDAMVLRDRKPWVVMDTKWKRLSSEQPNLGVSSGDVYQVLAYSQRFQTSMAVLVYPHMPGIARVQRVWTQGSPDTTSGAHGHIDLAHLRMYRQVERGLLP
jgi:5-methylcytosine-specific restriction enzyme subunit McrC